jgi:hypothetical protein
VTTIYWGNSGTASYTSATNNDVFTITNTNSGATGATYTSNDLFLDVVRHQVPIPRVNHIDRSEDNIETVCVAQILTHCIKAATKDMIGDKVGPENSVRLLAFVRDKVSRMAYQGRIVEYNIESKEDEHHIWFRVTPTSREAKLILTFTSFGKLVVSADLNGQHIQDKDLFKVGYQQSVVEETIESIKESVKNDSLGNILVHPDRVPELLKAIKAAQMKEQDAIFERTKMRAKRAELSASEQARIFTFEDVA